MKVGARIRDLVVIALIGGSLYLAAGWHFDGAESAGNGAHAEANCVRDISNRFDGQSVKAYSVKENSSGYVVRASVTVRQGIPAKVICLTDERGWVKDIEIIEH